MAAGYHVTKTAGYGTFTLGVHVVYEDDQGQTTELVRIGCADVAEQDRIWSELIGLLRLILPP
jgi:hypothetical protein